jgi:hypothetical protein
VSAKEWLTDLGAAAEELGYGIARIEPDTIELVARQQDVHIRIESRLLSGDLLRRHLVKIEHRSGSGYTADYERVAR